MDTTLEHAKSVAEEALSRLTGTAADIRAKMEAGGYLYGRAHQRNCPLAHYLRAVINDRRVDVLVNAHAGVQLTRYELERQGQPWYTVLPLPNNVTDFVRGWDEEVIQNRRAARPQKGIPA